MVNSNDKLEQANDPIINNKLDKDLQLSDAPRHNIKMQKVLFNFRLKRGEITAFRGAIAHKAGLDKEAFHNHKNSADITDSTYHHRYPLIQYQVHDGKAAIIGFGQGAEDLKAFVKEYDGKLALNNRSVNAPILVSLSTPSRFAISDKQKSYQLTHWIALNHENYAKWKQADGLIEQVEVLEKQLSNHIVSLCKATNWRPPEFFKVRITDFEERHVKYRNQRYLAFNVTYKTNLMLPQYFGLGRAVSEGFGMNVRLDT